MRIGFSIDRHNFTAGPSGQRRQDGIGGVAEEADGAVREGEVRPARVQAPEVGRGTAALDPVSREGRRRFEAAEFLRERRLADAKEGAAPVPAPPTAIPAAVSTIFARGALPDQERLAGAVADLDESDSRVEEEQAIAEDGVGAGDAYIRGGAIGRTHRI